MDSFKVDIKRRIQLLSIFCIYNAFFFQAVSFMLQLLITRKLKIQTRYEINTQGTMDLDALIDKINSPKQKKKNKKNNQKCQF